MYNCLAAAYGYDIITDITYLAKIKSLSLGHHDIDTVRVAAAERSLASALQCGVVSGVQCTLSPCHHHYHCSRTVLTTHTHQFKTVEELSRKFAPC